MSKKGYQSVLLIALLVVMMVISAGCGSSKASVASKKSVVNIGYQKASVLSVLKVRGDLEKKFSSKGIKVKWFEFSTGLSLLEALNSGNIDVGNAGDAPTVFAQAKGIKLLYAASEPASPESEGILVPKNSSIKTISDLKGKKVAYAKASISQYLLIQTLAKAGLTINDVVSKQLPPPDARAAFDSGSVDAWVVWDPFFTVTEASGARILSTAKGIVSYNSFYLANQDFAKQSPAELEVVIGELKNTADWINNNRNEAAQLLAKDSGLPVPVWEKILERKKYGANPVSQETVAEQERIVQTFLQLKLIDSPVNVKDSVWKSKE